MSSAQDLFQHISDASEAMHDLNEVEKFVEEDIKKVQKVKMTFTQHENYRLL